MDAPKHRFRAFAGIQLPAGVHSHMAAPRRGLADQASFVRTIENEADLAQDKSKLSHDFGAA